MKDSYPGAGRGSAVSGSSNATFGSAYETETVALTTQIEVRVDSEVE